MARLDTSSLTRTVNEHLEALNNSGPDKIETTRLKALSEARLLVDSLITPMEKLSQSMFQPNLNLCLRLALEMDLFSTLSLAHPGSINGEDFHPEQNPRVPAAKILNESKFRSPAQNNLIVRVLRTIAAGGFIEEVDTDVYAANRMTNALMEPASVAMFNHCFDIVLPTVVRMPAFFRHNDFTLPTHQTPFQFCNETSLAYFDWLLAHPEAHDRFITGMQGNRLGKPFWATWYPVRERILHSFDATTNSPFFVDIGGNTGYDLVRLQTELANIDADIVRAQYGSKPFVLQDLARVIESIQEEELCRLNRAGIRCEKYDFFTPQRTKGAHVYFMHFVLHDFPDSTAGHVLYNTALGMTPNASILLLNEIVLPARCIPLQMALWDVQMMAVVGGRERTQSDWRSLVENVGNYGAKQDVKLEIIRIWTPPNNQGEGIIEIVRRQ